MSNKESAASSGIVVDTATGERHVPSSTRADGSKRKEIRIRPGYQPPEDVRVYKNPSAAAWQTRGKGGVPGAEGLGTSGGSPAASAASNKNAKRREAKKKAKSEEKADDENKPGVAGLDAGKEEVAQKPLDPEAEKEKKARNLKKKLRQARDLRDKKDKGESLLPEQLAKIIKINELIRELDSLGFDSDGDTKP